MSRALDRDAFDCPKCGETVNKYALGLKVRFARCCTADERFVARLKPTTKGCIEHQGCRDKWGYAHIAVDGKRKQAHRYAWERVNGPVPAGMLVMHSCDNPPCCNLAHLSLGTDKENMQDKMSKERDSTCVLTYDQVREVRGLLGTMKQKDIAHKFGVKYGVISDIKLGYTYQHVI